MRDPFQNPFPASDAPRHAIWEMLVPRDIDAFLAADWSMVAGDFVEEGFIGIDSRREVSPDKWRLAFPGLAAYRDEWLRQARDFATQSFAEDTRTAIFTTTTLEDIEIEGDMALVRKKFDGSLKKSDGSIDVMKWQTLYYCRLHEGRWKISGFTGYLPNPMEIEATALRIFTAALATETNTFSPICIDRRAFEASLYAPPGTHPETPTLCSAPITVGRQVAAQKGWELIEGTATWADPAGLVNRRTYEDLRDEILDQLRAAMPVDAVVLGLHGAMVADGYEDTEGDFLARVREIVGPDILVCAELDPHSHLTKKRLAAAEFFVYFKEFPHTDFVDRAEDLWRIAVDTLEGRVKPVMSVFDCRMIDVFPTSREPMRSFVDKIMAMEEADPDILSISVIHGFMAGDVPEMGTKLLVVTDNKPDKGSAIARNLGLELFSKRGTFIMPQIDEKEAVSQAMAATSGPIVIADLWDNPGGGTSGDATVILQELLDRGATDTAIGTIWDPMAVQICMAAGEGAEIPLRFGAKSAPGTGNPIDGHVKIIRVVANAEMRFGESFAPFGDAAYIQLDGIDIILNSTRAQSFDPSLFSVMGIDPTAKKILVIKSTNHFYASFSKIASEILYCSAGTPYPNNPARTPYRRAPKDIWPMVADPHATGRKGA